MSSFTKNLRHAARYHASSGVKFKHENTAFTNTTHSTKIMWTVLSPNCNMTPLWEPCLCTMTEENLVGLTVV